jgi:hypothetical protein
MIKINNRLKKTFEMRSRGGKKKVKSKERKKAAWKGGC